MALATIREVGGQRRPMMSRLSGVAAQARRAQALHHIASMTVGTLESSMHSTQWEPSLRVMEESVLPELLSMAIAAIG